MEKKRSKKATLKGVALEVEALSIQIASLRSHCEGEHRKIGVLLERLEYKFDLALEGFGVLNVKSSNHEERIQSLEEKIN